MSLSPAAEQMGSAPEVNIRDYLNVIRRRKTVFIQVFVMVLAVGIVVTALSKPVYRTRASLVVPPSQTTISIQDASNPIDAMLRGAAPDNMATQIQVLQSEPFMERAREKAGIKPASGAALPFVRVEGRDVTGNANVIDITVEGGNPEQIATLANAILTVHLADMEEHQTGSLRDTIEMVRDLRKEAAEALRQAEDGLIAFRKAHQVAQQSVDQEARAREYVDLQARVAEAESNVTSTEAQVAELRARLKTEPLEITTETTRENPRVARLEERLDGLRTRRLELELEYEEGAQPLVDLDAQIKRVRDELSKEPPELRRVTHTPNPSRAPLQSNLAQLEASLQGYIAQRNEARARFNSRRALIDDLRPWEIQQARLERERESQQAAYTELSNQLRTLEIREEAQLPTARILEKAKVPATPIAPRKATNIALSALLALCLAAGMAFLQEYLDDRVNSPDDVERISALPSLGHVPLMESGRPRLVNALPANSHVAESYRALRSSIGFAGIDAPIRRLQVTSASKGEGKTITSVNLATAMAIDGKRVILVDSDLRRPSVHRLLNVPNSPGLSEVLVGMKSIGEAIQETDVENLSVVCAGPVPPNPAELLGSRAFDRVIEELEERADVVIFDSPPCLPVTDPLIIAGRMDGVVLVLHTGHTKKAAIKHVEQLLGRARARIIGVVFNRVQQNRSGYYYQHYYYYYGDGYYADTASRGERHRRNGKARKPELAAGVAQTKVQVLDDDDRDA